LAWGALLLVQTAWLLFQDSRREVFEQSYTLGVDEVQEEHDLAWLASSRYLVTVHFEEPQDRKGLESRTTFREAIGGDIAVELVTSSGEVVVPRQFVLGDAKVEWKGDFHPFDYRHYARRYNATIAAQRRLDDLDGFRTGLFERFRLRIATVKSTGDGHPQRVTVSCAGPMHKGPPPWTIPVTFFIIVGLPSALLLWLLLWWTAKRCAAKPPSPWREEA
jgi:hypothetical protein